MRQLQYTRPGLALADVRQPIEISATGVRIRVAYASLCGTDLHILRGDFDRLLGDGPTPLGHEASGVVEALGADAHAKGLSVGDAVTFYFNRYCGACESCRGGREQFCTAVTSAMGFMSDVVVVDEQQVFKLPADISLAAAALIEPVTVALRGIDLCNIRPGMSVAVSGGGGIGQIACTLARRSGATALTLIEPVADKRALAIARGADHAIDPTRGDLPSRAAAITGDRGFDVVIEASGSPRAAEAAMQIAAKGGTVELLATYAPDAVLGIGLGDAFVREVTLITGVYQSPYVFPRAVALAPSLALDELTTIFAPEDYRAGFDAQSSGASVKTVFDFTDSATKGHDHG